MTYSKTLNVMDVIIKSTYIFEDTWRLCSDGNSTFEAQCLLLEFSLTVKAAPHECVIRTGQPKA